VSNCAAHVSWTEFRPLAYAVRSMPHGSIGSPPKRGVGVYAGRSGAHQNRSWDLTVGGPDPILEVRSVHVEVPDQLGGPNYISRGPALSHGGPDSLLTPCSISLSPATWRSWGRPRGGARRCCWPRVVTRGWGESWSGPTYNSFTTRLKIAVWVLRLHTVVRGTLVSGYRQDPFTYELRASFLVYSN
jgi:hypothetical protein